MDTNGIKTAMVSIEGVSPLLMHNGQMVDAANEWTQKIKEITSKHHSKKTDEDAIELNRLEFNGGLYFDDKLGPYIPAVNVEGCIRDAATAKSKGKAITAGMQVNPEKIELIYDGPRTRQGLYDNKNFVDARPIKLQKSTSVIRVRPRFDKWQLDFEILVFSDVVDISTVRWALELGGKVKGLSDFRPKFGRFIVKEFEEI